MSNIFFKPNRPMPSNVRKYIKRAGYVRGYFPELASHVGEWIPGGAKATGSFMWNNMGRLATLAALAAGGYAMWNKYKKDKKKKDDDDDKYYSEVPQEAKSDKKPNKKWNLWSWSDDESEDSDYDDSTKEDVPIDVLADAYGYRRTGIAAPKDVVTTIDLANQKPGSHIILKTSNYILRKSNKRVNTVKGWLHK